MAFGEREEENLTQSGSCEIDRKVHALSLSIFIYRLILLSIIIVFSNGTGRAFVTSLKLNICTSRMHSTEGLFISFNKTPSLYILSACYCKPMFDEVPICQTTVAGGSSTSIQRTSTHEVGEEWVSSTLVSCNDIPRFLLWALIDD